MFSFLFAAQSPRLIYDVERGLDANESIMTSFRTDFRSLCFSIFRDSLNPINKMRVFLHDSIHSLISDHANFITKLFKHLSYPWNKKKKEKIIFIYLQI